MFTLLLPVTANQNPLANADPKSLQAATINETAAMESLMRTYEKQLQNPIYGMLYGNLMTAMLIQMQKLKGIIFYYYDSIILIYLFTYLFVYLHISSFIYTFTHTFIDLFIYLSTSSYICL